MLLIRQLLLIIIKGLVKYLPNFVIIKETIISFIYKYSMIETLLSYGWEAKSTHLQTAHFYRDNPDTCKQNVKDASGVAKARGYEKRRKLVEKSQIVPFATSLHIDFLTCPRFVLICLYKS